jgi:ubiquinone/menaquinone biosynthesis C-methylase UbiE
MTTKLDLHYTDPRLAELYDIANPHGPDTDFYLELAHELQAKKIIDFGCGTGYLTRQLAVRDREVIGIDPAPAMLAIAQRKDIEQNVQWINGDKSLLGTRNADLFVMTGNVAQVFLDDDEWSDLVHSIWHVLRPGGFVAFESRNPGARQWEEWTPEATRTTTITPFGDIEEWLEVVDVTPRTVRFKGYNHFQKTGETLVVDSELRFRTLEEITQSLEHSGFEIESVYGGWKRESFTTSCRPMIFVAKRG